VVGVGMVGIETYVTEGDLVRSEGGRPRPSELAKQGRTEPAGASEESERLIVALTPRESGEQSRSRSQKGKRIVSGASLGHRESPSSTFGPVPKDEARVTLAKGS
jgi:hypothetical protein